MDYKWQITDFGGLGKEQLYAALRLRQQVFTVEQNSVYLDLDNLDQGAMHMLCWQGAGLVAYQRCLAPGASYRESALGRIVVSIDARGKQLGKALVQRGLRYNLERWPGVDVRINAQSYLRKFYADLGFAADGDEYGLDGIPHLQMLYSRSA